MNRSTRQALGGALIVLALIVAVIIAAYSAWPSGGFEIGFSGVDEGSGEAFHGVVNIEPAGGE